VSRPRREREQHSFAIQTRHANIDRVQSDPGLASVPNANTREYKGMVRLDVVALRVLSDASRRQPRRPNDVTW